jgi:hypothetical protein
MRWYLRETDSQGWKERAIQNQKAKAEGVGEQGTTGAGGQRLHLEEKEAVGEWRREERQIWWRRQTPLLRQPPEAEGDPGRKEGLSRESKDEAASWNREEKATVAGHP